MNEKAFKNILLGSLAALLIFSVIARGAVRLWSVTPVLLALYLLIFLRLRQGVSSFKKTPLDKLIFSFVALATISFIFSIYKHDSFYTLLRVLAYVGLYYIILNNFDKPMRNWLLAIVVGLGFILSAYGLLQYFGKLEHSWWEPAEFLAATYVNHNHFAGFLELVIPVSIAVLMSCPAGRFYRSLGFGVIVAVLFLAFALAQSRAGWISLAISLLVMVVIIFKKTQGQKKNVFVWFLIAIVLFGGLYIKRDVLYKRVKQTTDFTQGEKEASFETRLLMWKATLKMVRDNPLIGVGIGDFDAGYYRYRPKELCDQRAVYAHNDYLHMAAEMGILAPLLMIGMLFIILKTGLKRNNDPLILGCSAGVLSLALHGLADFNFHIPANMLLFTIYAGFIMSARKEQR